jgi:hypothetical protein
MHLLVDIGQLIFVFLTKKLAITNHGIDCNRGDIVKFLTIFVSSLYNVNLFKSELLPLWKLHIIKIEC